MKKRDNEAGKEQERVWVKFKYERDVFG